MNVNMNHSADICRSLPFARSLASNSYKVFPCRPNSKIPATPNGFKDASSDPSHPSHPMNWDNRIDYNYGIPTGQTNNLTVVDIDGPEGLASLKDLSDLLGFDLFTYTYSVSTPSGGLHLYFSYRPGLPQTVKILPGIDTRNDGGYVVGPGSHIDGKMYDIIDPTAEIKPMPERLAALIIEKSSQSVAQVHTQANNGPNGDLIIPTGGRNNYLTKLAGSMRRRGMSEESILAALEVENNTRLASPLPEWEVKNIARSVGRYVPGKDAAEEISSVVSYEEGVDKSESAALGLADTTKAGQAGNDLLLKADTFLDAAISYMKDKDKVKGQPTGLESIDRMLGGGKRLGEVTCWHAEAKTGKNTLWHYLMYLLLEVGIPQAYASRELSPESEVLPNLLSVKFGENAWLAEMSEDRVEKYRQPVKEWPLYFSQGYGYFPPEDIRKWVLSAKAQGINYFWFDHLHYMLDDPEDHKAASKLIKELKTLAKQENIHIDIIIQPNKLMDGQKLSLNSIKGGAAMGQAIDNLLILERVKRDDGSRNFSKLTLEVARSKLAKPGSLFLQFDPDTCRFEEAVVEPQAEDEIQSRVNGSTRTNYGHTPETADSPNGYARPYENREGDSGYDLGRQWMLEKFGRRI